MQTGQGLPAGPTDGLTLARHVIGEWPPYRNA